jgi:hypothetical protein
MTIVGQSEAPTRLEVCASIFDSVVDWQRCIYVYIYSNTDFFFFFFFFKKKNNFYVDQGNYKAMVVCWILGMGSLVSWNSLLTIGDYYYKLFPVS